MQFFNLKMRVNLVNKLFLLELCFINFMLHILGYTGVVWYPKKKLAKPIYIFGGYNMHYVVVCVQLVVVMLIHFVFHTGSFSVLTTSFLIFLALRFFINPHALSDNVNLLVDVFTTVRTDFRLRNVCKLKHLLNGTANIAVVLWQTGFMLMFFKRSLNGWWYVLTAKLLPDMLCSMVYFSFLISQALYEHTAEELAKIYLQYDRIKYLPMESKISTLKKYGQDIRLLTKNYIKIQKATEMSCELCSGLFVCNLLYVIVVSFSIVDLAATMPLGSFVIFHMGMFCPIVQFLQFGRIGDQLLVETKRPLNIINVENLNICRSYDKSIDVFVLWALRGDQPMKPMQMYTLNSKFVTKFFLILVFINLFYIHKELY